MHLCQAEELNRLDHEMLLCAAPCSWDTLSVPLAVLSYMRSHSTWQVPATFLTWLSAPSKQLRKISSCFGSDVFEGVSLGLFFFPILAFSLVPQENRKITFRFLSLSLPCSWHCVFSSSFVCWLWRVPVLSVHSVIGKERVLLFVRLILCN